MATGYPAPVGSLEDDSTKLAEDVCEWTSGVLTEENKLDLARLPFLHTLSSGRMSAACFNATPIDMGGIPHEQQPDDYFREMGSYTGANINVFSHTHLPFWRVVDGRWFVNAGSVGFCRDSDGRPSYARIELNGGAAVEIVRVDYDRDRTARASREAGLPSGILRLIGSS